MDHGDTVDCPPRIRIVWIVGIVSMFSIAYGPT
jgi:hypothetical protein